MRKDLKIAAIGMFAIFAGLAFFLSCRLGNVQAQLNRARANIEVLHGETDGYRFRDSLSGARIQALELTAKEFERFRAEDAATIRELKKRNRDLQALTKAQARTIAEFSAPVRDTIVFRDTIQVSGVAVHAGDKWYDFDGVLAGGEFTGRLETRDNLLVAETVQYRRFLGFLWKTRHVKDRQVDVVSENPHTKIEKVDFVFIEK